MKICLRWLFLTLAFYFVFNVIHYLILYVFQNYIGFKYFEWAAPFSYSIFLLVIGLLYFKYRPRVEKPDKINFISFILLPIIAFFIKVVQDPILNFREIIGIVELPESVENRDYGFKYRIGFLYYSVLIAPIFEEVFFRGMVLTSLLNKGLGVIQAILFSAFLFSLIHFNPINIEASSLSIVSNFVFGAILGIVYYRKKSLILVIILHALLNFIAYLINIYSGDYINLLDNFHFGYLYWLLFLVSVLGLYYSIRLLIKERSIVSGRLN